MKSIRCTRFIFILLLASYYSIEWIGGTNLHLDKVNFLTVLLQLPTGINEKDVQNIRSTLKTYEDKMLKLNAEAENCKASSLFNCFASYDRLQVASREFFHQKRAFVLIINTCKFFR